MQSWLILAKSSGGTLMLQRSSDICGKSSRKSSHTRTLFRALFSSESFPIIWICSDSINHEHILILYTVIHARARIDFMWCYSFVGILSKAFAFLYVSTIFCINVNYNIYKDIFLLLLLLFIIIFTNYINFIHFGSIYVDHISD